MPIFTRLLWIVLISTAIAMPAFSAGIRDLEEQVNTLERRLSRMERQNQVLMEMYQRLEAMQKEVRLLRGDSEQGLHEIDILKKRQRELYLDIDQRLQILEGGKTSSEVKTSPAMSAKTEPGPSTEPAKTGGGKQQGGSTYSAEEQEVYKRAFNMLKDKRYQDSIGAFSAFISKYPQSVYAGNAQYWLAEANYVSRSYANALLEFKKVLERYPESSKVPDATLKLGFTHYELAQWDEAKKVLNALRKQYSNSTVARLAGKRLQRMKREGH
ncbi:MAG: tol-pal system protein YbgF [Gammaproteobacteria bacterium]|nr:tol-pal system protein YbgF [Gammaproteobacteria bacterium]